VNTFVLVPRMRHYDTLDYYRLPELLKSISGSHQK
jgi:hypothetical protein